MGQFSAYDWLFGIEQILLLYAFVTVAFVASCRSSSTGGFRSRMPLSRADKRVLSGHMSF